MLDLNDDVVIKLAVQWMENVVRGARTIRFCITPVQMMVVNKLAIKQTPAVRRERPRNCVRRIRWSSAVGRWANSSFGICFDSEATKVRNEFVDFIGFGLPPLGNSWIERIKRIETTNRFRTAQIDGKRKSHSPRAKRIRDARNVRQKITLQRPRIRVYIVHVAAVDANRRQQPRVFRSARQISAYVSAIKENRLACVAALDTAVQ